MISPGDVGGDEMETAGWGRGFGSGDTDKSMLTPVWAIGDLDISSPQPTGTSGNGMLPDKLSSAFVKLLNSSQNSSLSSNSTLKSLISEHCMVLSPHNDCDVGPRNAELLNN